MEAGLLAQAAEERKGNRLIFFSRESQKKSAIPWGRDKRLKKEAQTRHLADKKPAKPGKKKV